MSNLRRILGMALALLFAYIAPLCAQNYPTKPIRMLTAGAGGGNDVIARLLAQGLTSGLGQQVIVDNRASGLLPGEIVAKAAPDGYTLLAYGNSIWIGQLVRGDVVLDPLRDFSPITVTGRAPNILVVHPTLPVKTVKELIAYAKEKPGVLNYSSGATGASTHLAAELFKSMAGVNIVRIPYKSGATEMADLIGGQVQLTFGTTATVTPHVKSGRLRALAVTSLQPSALAPGLPTVAASGLPGYESGSVYGFYAPAKTPPAIIKKLNQETVRYLNLAETQERFLITGVEAMGSSPEQFIADIKTDMGRLGKMIKETGIRAE